jgi:FKBP-type peptidyl-prolyl cis-trans isomerase FkpA
MKQTVFTLFLFTSIAFISCRKSNQQNITQYDAQQIQEYIAANNLTGFTADPTGGDTSGIYYKILQQPNTSNPPLAYTDNISFVFTLRSFDGKYVSSDTILNHYQGYLGHIVTDALPYGLELAIINDLKYYGGSMRVLIPSRLAYGINGYGTGSNTVTSTHIAGNQCLDYYVHVINAEHDSLTYITAAQAQLAYDYQVINNYITTNSLTGEYTLDSGVYYRIVTQGTGTDRITNNTTAELNFFGRLMDNVNFENDEGADSASLAIPNLIQGVQRTLRNHAVTGTTISMLIPSQLAYGQGSISATLATVPANSCLRLEFTVVSVSP